MYTITIILGTAFLTHFLFAPDYTFKVYGGKERIKRIWDALKQEGGASQ